MKKLRIIFVSLIFISCSFMVTSVVAGQPEGIFTPAFNYAILFCMVATGFTGLKIIDYKLKKVSKHVEEATGQKI